MKFEKLLLEVNKRLPNDSTVPISKIKDSIKKLPQLLRDVEFNKCFFCPKEELGVAYGVSLIVSERRFSDAEIDENVEAFKSVISEIFNMDSNFKVNFICPYDEFWEYDKRILRYYGFGYCLIWSIFRKYE